MNYRRSEYLLSHKDTMAHGDIWIAHIIISTVCITFIFLLL
jgi:hypothetical protein